MELKHTPGPWVHFKINNFQSIRTEKELITEYNGNDPNAKLIAAAPELLNALMACYNWAKNGNQENLIVFEQARQAIEKATGNI